MPESSGAAAPYPGLRPFDSQEAEVFFGREAHTDRLLEILQREHFLAVIGPSGSGKSSLVRAGLLPSLKMGSLGSGSDWRVAVLRPGNQPMRSLAAALLQPDVFGHEMGAATVVDHAAAEDVALLAAELGRGPLGLLHATRSARTGGARPAASPVNLLVLVDQFEEVFTYAEAGGEHADESDALVNLLLAARADTQARVYVVLTMRTDFLGNCVRFADLPEAINRAQYLTPRLTRSEMERAIVGPAEVFGGSVDSSLVAELINATGQNSDQLPLLQHALSRMWTRAAARGPAAPAIGWEDATHVGGLSGALDQHAESVLAQVLGVIGADRAPLVEGLFCAITERRAAAGGGQDVRRPQTLSRIASACGLGDDGEALAPIVRAYAAPDVSLLQHGRVLGGDSVIDLSHEALMRQWTRLSHWVGAESRRGNDYRRWAERAIDHAENRGGLLEGAALARAAEWLNGDASLGETWRPTAPWAARYALSDESAAEFARTVAFIEESAAHARRKQEEERASIERERSQAIERAQAAERAARRARIRTLLIGVVALIVAALGGATLYYARQSSAAAARAEVLAKQASDQRDRAERLATQLDAMLKIAVPLSPANATPGGARSISLSDLAAIMPGSTAQSRMAFLQPLSRAMAEFDINTPLRQAHFLGQVSIESGDFRGLEERWGPTPQQLRYEPSNSLGKSLGNTEPGDAERYRGRGIFHIVGRGNYKRFGDALNVDLVGNPDVAARPDVAVRFSAMYWQLKGLNALADADDLQRITRQLTGGVAGLEARSRAVARAKAALNVAVP